MMLSNIILKNRYDKNFWLIMEKHSVGFIGGGVMSQIAHLPFYLANKNTKQQFHIFRINYIL